MQENTDKIVSDIYNKSFEKYLKVKFHKNVPKQLAKLINDNLPDPSSFEKREGIEVLKLGRQRFVYRTFLNDKIYSSMIVKLFPLRNPASFIKYKKYAPQEYANSSTAVSMGIATPKPLCLVIYRKLGFVIGTGIIIEDLYGYKNIKEIGANNLENYLGACLQSIPLFSELYNKGANHTDIRDENIMINSNKSPNMACKVIDWQYANFVKPKANWLLEHLCSNFIRNAPSDFKEALESRWLAAIHEKSQSEINRDLFINRVKILVKKKTSTRSKLSLSPVGI